MVLAVPSGVQGIQYSMPGADAAARTANFHSEDVEAHKRHPKPAVHAAAGKLILEHYPAFGVKVPSKQ